MKRKIRLSALLTLFAVFSIASVFAQSRDNGNIMLIRDIDAEPGDIVTVELEIINDDEVAGFNIDILIPPGFEFQEGTAQLFRDIDHQFVISTPDVDYDLEGTVVRVIAFSIELNTFTGNEGVIFSFDALTPDVPDFYPIKILGWPEEDYPGYPQPPVIGSPDFQNILDEAIDGELFLGIRDLTITTEGEGSVDVDGEPYTETVMVPIGTAVDLLATADPGWEFVNWTGDTGGLDDPDVFNPTLTMPDTDVSLTANFQLSEYTLTLLADPVEGGTVEDLTDDAPYNIDDLVQIRAEANEGWEFVNWTGEYADNLVDATAAETTLTMPADDVTLTANFQMIDYTLTVNVDPEDSGTVDIVPDQDSYNVGDVISLTATPEDGWEFVNWTGDTGGLDTTTDAEATLTMPADDVTLTANFQMIDYTLTVNIEPAGSGTVDIDPEEDFYNIGDEISLTATPEAGWEFVNWTGDTGGLDDPNAAEATLTMPADNVELTANFQIITYDLTINIEPAGSGTVEVDPDQDSFNAGDEVSLTAIPEAGWEFVNWTGDVAGLDDPSAAQTTLTMPADDVTLTANFEMIDYTLTINIEPTGSGTVDIDPEEDFYNVGDEIDLTATPEAGWEFVNWTGDTEGLDDINEAETTLTMPADNVELTANFQLITYDLTINIEPEGAGTVDVVPDQDSYNVGDQIDLTATPEDGWMFVNWTGDVAGLDDPDAAQTTLTMPADDVTLTANFEAIDYTLSVNVDPTGSGTVDIDPDQDFYNVGDEIDLTAMPEDGWEFVNWTGDTDGLNTTTGAEATLTMPADDVTLTANFQLIDYTLTLVANPDEGGTVEDVTDDAPYNIDDLVQIRAEANEGWEFVNWTGEYADNLDDADETETTLTMPADDVTLTANFEMIDYTLTVNIDPMGSGIVDIDPDQDSYNFGDEISLTAIPEDGWEFVEWTGDTDGLDTPTDAEATLTMPADDVTLTANFQLIDYTLTLIANPDEGGTVEDVTDDAPYNIDDLVQIRAEANEGWEFVNWTGDYADNLADADQAETTLTMPADDVTLTANFQMIDYTLTLTPDPAIGGTVEDLTDDAPYNVGDEVNIKAEPNPGWGFDGWTGEYAGNLDDASAAETTLTMPADNVDLTANFIVVDDNEYTVTLLVEPEEAGDVIGAGDYNVGDRVDIEAVANEGWMFVEWTGDIDGLDDPNSAETHFFMTPGDVTITANFDTVPEIPLARWAVYIMAALIAVFVTVRIRKKMVA